MEVINKNTILGNFKETKGRAMKQWAKLTDNDFLSFKGNIEELKGKIQHLYGYTTEKLESELAHFKSAIANPDKAEAKLDTNRIE